MNFLKITLSHRSPFEYINQSILENQALFWLTNISAFWFSTGNWWIWCKILFLFHRRYLSQWVFVLRKNTLWPKVQWCCHSKSKGIFQLWGYSIPKCALENHEFYFILPLSAFWFHVSAIVLTKIWNLIIEYFLNNCYAH